MKALGMVEAVGYSTAVYAADAGLKAANVKLKGIERVIGVAGSLGVSVEFEGEVAAVQSAVSAAKEAGESVGRVVSTLVIARVHEEVSHRILPLFDLHAGDDPEPPVKAAVENTTGDSTSPGVEPAEQSVNSGLGGTADEGGATTSGSSTKRRTKHE